MATECMPETLQLSEQQTARKSDGVFVEANIWVPNIDEMLAYFDSPRTFTSGQNLKKAWLDLIVGKSVTVKASNFNKAQ